MDLSIIIPFYKNVEHLARLLRSLKIAHEKIGAKNAFEIIVIIDSPDDSINSVHNLIVNEIGLNSAIQIKVFKNDKNLGVSSTRNIGIENSTGDFIHFIDQDDEVDEDFYKLTFPKLSNCDFLLTNCLFVEDNVRFRLFYLTPVLTLKTLILDNFVRSPGQVILRRIFIGNVRFPISVNFKGCDDRFFWILLFNQKKEMRYKYIAKPIYIAHLHSNNYSNNSQELFKCVLELWNKLDKIDFGDHKKYIQKNKAAFNYIVGNKRSLYELIEYINYQFNLNKIIRFIIKWTNKKLQLLSKS